MIKSDVYPFITKDGSISSFKSIDTDSFNTDFQFGDVLSSSNYPLTATISSEYYTSGSPTPLQPKRHLTALKNTLNYYKHISPYYAYSGSFGDKETLPLRLISVPSIFYGKNIKKGSVSCKWYVEGQLIGEIGDIKRNGELIQTFGNNIGNVAGVILYSEGFVILTGSWDLNPLQYAITEQQETEYFISEEESFVLTEADIEIPSNIQFNWTNYMNTGSTEPFYMLSSSFDFSFEGVEEIPTITMFAHAEKGEFNYSNNPTFIEYDSKQLKTTGSQYFIENDEAEIKNIVKVNYEQVEPDFEKTTFISSIGLYDDTGNLIGIAKLATPVRKREIDSVSFKLKLDI